MISAIAACLALLSFAHGQQTTVFAPNQLTTSGIGERAQRALFPNNPFLLGINSVTGTSLVDNPAARQLQGDKAAFPFLATLPNQGSAVFITTLKGCGSINFHTHMRATEQYVIVSGKMIGGIAEENGGRNFTFDVNPGQSFVVPQGLVHWNGNPNCTPLVFLQIFNSADPGTITLGNAITALTAADPSGALSSSSNVTASLTGFGAFALDQTCLARCGSTTASNGLGALSPELRAFVGLSGGSPTSAPSASVRSASTPSSAPAYSGSG